MGHLKGILSKSNLFKTLLLILLLGIFGCNSNEDIVVVDFSKRIPVKYSKNNISKSSRLNVAVAAMISPKETFLYYNQLLNYIGNKLNKEIHFIQRKTYHEVDVLLSKGELDLAFICAGPYTRCKDKYAFEALAIPVVSGISFYQSYLIVNKNSSYHSIEDLKGRVFAFTDPESNTGKVVPAYWLITMEEKPETFFSKFIYTYSHDNSILAVAKSLVDGAAVHSLIWEYYNKNNNSYTSKTRIIKKSNLFGNPPIVAPKKMSSDQKEKIRELLYTMHLNEKGKKILDALMIDHFIAPKDKWYDPIREMQACFSGDGGQNNANK